MRHEFIEALCGALFGLALITLEKALPVPYPYNILIAGTAGALGFVGFFVLYWRVRHSRMMRKWTDDLHSFEGDWLEEWCDGDKPRYSIATIRFDSKTKQYRLAGIAYDKDGQIVSDWKSTHIFYDDARDRLIYVSDGHQVEGRNVFGATCIFLNNPTAIEGIGFFVDDISGELNHFEIVCTRLISTEDDKPWLSDPKTWIRQCHAEHASRRRKGQPSRPNASR